MQVVGYMCGPRLYEYEGWCFEFSQTGGPWPIRKDGEPYKRAGVKFWDMFGRFTAMPEEERESYRVGGGCEPLVKKEAGE